MKRNTTLTLIMMLGSVAAAVAAPDAPPHQVAVDCLDLRRVTAAVERDAIPAQHASAAAVMDVQRREASKLTGCVDDVTAPYRRLHHGGMKLSSACGDAT